ncbi:hypothetical protein AAEU32_09380 [Pseudoalteromonas sp. SSDWG2]|uniref:hypothetical protein n=1 Tax=Pseudoalteromonas sp. SSDWG2 TaxID=3139391 RepID=UPI003BA86F99
MVHSELCPWPMTTQCTPLGSAIGVFCLRYRLTDIESLCNAGSALPKYPMTTAKSNSKGQHALDINSHLLSV